jgi:hypothetical protein
MKRKISMHGMIANSRRDEERRAHALLLAAGGSAASAASSRAAAAACGSTAALLSKGLEMHNGTIASRRTRRLIADSGRGGTAALAADTGAACDEYQPMALASPFKP